MKKIWSVCVMLVLLAASLLVTGCEQKPVLVLYNWVDYIEKSVLEDFEKEFNCVVKYNTFDDNEVMLNKLKSTNSAYDVIFPSDYTIERMIKDDLLSPLDLSKVPNLANISESYKNRSFDPGNKYSVPYMWGTIGILYNTTMVTEEINSWGALFDAKYEKNVLMMDSVRDALAVALFHLGYSMNTTDDAQIAEAKALLIQQKNTTVKAYGLDDIKDKMARGEAALALVYSGDATVAMDKNADLDYVLPESGTNLWFDGMVIPKNAANKDLAHAFINYMCRPDVASRNEEEIGYCTPVTETFEGLDEEVRNNKNLYPDAAYLEKCEIFKDLGEKMRDYTNLWLEVKMA